MATQADFDRLSNWAVMLNPDAEIDRHKCHRVVPMEVLSLGFSRTATLSMQEAFRILGYPDPYHYSSIFENVRDADMWQEAFYVKFRGKGNQQLDWRRHFDQLLGHCGAVTDAPAVLFWRELIEAYPDAKIILVERDEERWLPSFSVLIEGVLNPMGRYVFRFTDPLWFGRIINLGAAWIEAFCGSIDLPKAKTNAIPAYRVYYAAIRANVPKDRLLEYRLGSGWEPLCEHLGKSLPEVAFPRRNDAQCLDMTFGVVIFKAVKHSLLNLAIVVGVASVLGAGLWQYL
ncbi:hypothetical protein MMC25_006329 [Agyrium rufum]|nr:hypothetical protein [Agyrium rufum]